MLLDRAVSVMRNSGGRVTAPPRPQLGVDPVDVGDPEGSGVSVPVLTSREWSRTGPARVAEQGAQAVDAGPGRRQDPGHRPQVVGHLVRVPAPRCPVAAGTSDSTWSSVTACTAWPSASARRAAARPPGRASPRAAGGPRRRGMAGASSHWLVSSATNRAAPTAPRRRGGRRAGCRDHAERAALAQAHRVRGRRASSSPPVPRSIADAGTSARPRPSCTATRAASAPSVGPDIQMPPRGSAARRSGRRRPRPPPGRWPR